MSGHDFAVPSGVPQPYDQQQHYAGAAATRAHQAGAVYGSPISYQLTPPIPGSSTLQQEENPYDTNDWQHHGRSASSHSSPNQQSAAGTNSASASTMKKTTVQNRSAMACLLCRKQKMKCEGQDKAPCKRCRAAKVTCTFEPSVPAPSTSTRSRGGVSKEWVETRMSTVEGRLNVLEKRASTSSSGDTSPDVSSPPTPGGASPMMAAAFEARIAQLEAQVYALTLAAAGAPSGSSTPQLGSTMQSAQNSALYSHHQPSHLHLHQQQQQQAVPYSFGVGPSDGAYHSSSPQLGGLPPLPPHHVPQQHQQRYASHLASSAYPSSHYSHPHQHQHPPHHQQQHHQQQQAGSYSYPTPNLSDIHHSHSPSPNMVYSAPGAGSSSSGGGLYGASSFAQQQQSARPLSGQEDALGRLHPFAGGGGGDAPGLAGGGGAGGDTAAGLSASEAAERLIAQRDRSDTLGSSHGRP